MDLKKLLMRYLDTDLSRLVENINMTALALKYFGYGIPAFALSKILSNFFFARTTQEHHFIFQVLLFFKCYN